MTSTTHGPRPAHRWAAIGRHYLEMVLAMLVGMLVLGTGRALLGLTIPFAESASLSYLLMATDMAIAMAVWMRLRGCSRPMTLEMCAAMYLPIVLVPLVRVGAMGAMTFMLIAHIVMMVAMLLVLVRNH